MSFRKLIFIFLLVFSSPSWAQRTAITPQEADADSYQLYLNGNWPVLLGYGKEALKDNVDFTYLRLRMAYAAFMLKNYAEALKHYDAVLIKDSHNEVAHYYSRLCRLYLNQGEMAAYEVLPLSHIMSKENFDKEHFVKYRPTEAALESSLKFTDTSARGSANYVAAKLGWQLGHRINVQQSLIMYNQTISEPWYTGVTRNDSIAIRQKEYYNKVSVVVNHHWMLKGGYHFIYTPFNNYTFRNHMVMVGAKYYGSYLNLQAMLMGGKLNDSALQQLDLQAEYFPAGNLNIYGQTTASIHNSYGQKQFNIKQVLGFKLRSDLWTEVNATAGKFNNRFENDGAYVYNAIDNNIYKLGLNLFYYPTAHLQFMAGLTLEKREMFKTDYIFNQNSINGGITWKF